MPWWPFFFFSFHWKILREKISSLIIANIFSWTHFWINVKRISIKVENTLRILEEVAFIGGREEAGRKRFWPPRFVSWGEKGEKEHWLSAGNWTIAIGCFKCWNIYNIFFFHIKLGTFLFPYMWHKYLLTYCFLESVQLGLFSFIA